MISDAYVIATCDKCMETTQEVQLTSIVGNPPAYDMRNVRGALEARGWVLGEGLDAATCPECKGEAE
jgi:hypothetical protein